MLAPGAQKDETRARPVRRTFVRAELGRDAAAALALAKDFGLDPVVAGGEGLRERAEELAAQRAPVVLTGNSSTSAAPDSVRARRSSGLAAALVTAGLRPALGSGGAGASRFLRLLAAREIGEGLAPADALRSVTIWAAECAGVADSTGTLEPGKRADIVVWSGDPFSAASRAEMVFVRGRRVDE
jgi:imidazolonepropionase-like amidohydrolase